MDWWLRAIWLFKKLCFSSAGRQQDLNSKGEQTPASFPEKLDRPLEHSEDSVYADAILQAVFDWHQKQLKHLKCYQVYQNKTYFSKSDIIIWTNCFTVTFGEFNVKDKRHRAIISEMAKPMLCDYMTKYFLCLPYLSVSQTKLKQNKIHIFSRIFTFKCLLFMLLSYAGISKT